MGKGYQVNGERPFMGNLGLLAGDLGKGLYGKWG